MLRFLIEMKNDAERRTYDDLDMWEFFGKASMLGLFFYLCLIIMLFLLSLLKYFIKCNYMISYNMQKVFLNRCKNFTNLFVS